LLARCEALVAAAPRPDPALDQVAATPATLARRVGYLSRAFALDDARYLFVGDHDLTSLALAAVAPAAARAVVDVDDRLLAHLATGGAGAPAGTGPRCLWADLRAGLPPALSRWADVAVTDPPYTPAGVRLFVQRALEGLRDLDRGRVVLSYGWGDGVGLGLAVQDALAGLHLLFEAVLPGFNRYFGAEAIGSASNLYVLRPSARTAKALERAGARRGRAGWAGGIYTRGPGSAEATPAPLPEALVAEGMPVTDLRADPGPLLARVLLTDDRPALAVLVANHHPGTASAAGQRALSGLVGAKYRLRFRRSWPEDGLGLVEASAVQRITLDAAGRARRYLLDRAHAKVANAWPEGVIAASA
ncbi:MAG: bis-aminopropyl spermidine synthase family protein, partial [Acidimicrobiales bacterium]